MYPAMPTPMPRGIIKTLFNDLWSHFHSIPFRFLSCPFFLSNSYTYNTYSTLILTNIINFSCDFSSLEYRKFYYRKGSYGFSRLWQFDYGCFMCFFLWIAPYEVQLYPRNCGSIASFSFPLIYINC